MGSLVELQGKTRIWTLKDRRDHHGKVYVYRAVKHNGEYSKGKLLRIEHGNGNLMK